MESKPLSIVQLGLSGFPYGNRAGVNKIIAMSKGLLEAGATVTVINKKGIYEPVKGLEYPSSGIFEGIVYHTATSSAYRPKGFLQRNLRKIYGFFNEIAWLIRLKFQNRLDAAVVDTMYFSDILLYRILSFFLRFSLIYHYVEMRSKFDDPKNTTRRKLGNYLIDRYVTQLFDGFLPISELLENALKEANPKAPMHKVPVLCDYNKFQIDRNTFSEKYFLYCGSAAYSEVIYFIVEAFEGINDEGVFLYLIIGGSKERKEEVFENLAKSPKSHLIRTFSNIPYEELVEKYLHATALLIPLRPTIQDAARFPFKVSEYLATGNPVITTNYGELKNYFVDGNNGFVADKYDVDLFKDKMMYVLHQPEIARKVGKKGLEMGYNHFHYAHQGDKIKTFIESI